MLFQLEPPPCCLPCLSCLGSATPLHSTIHQGEFQERIGDGDGAHASYATAVSLCKQLSRPWLSWGGFCARRLKSSSAAGGAAGGQAPGQEGSAEWAEYAATCYLQGVKHGVQRWGQCKLTVYI